MLSFIHQDYYLFQINHIFKKVNSPHLMTTGLVSLHLVSEMYINSSTLQGNGNNRFFYSGFLQVLKINVLEHLF